MNMYKNILLKILGFFPYLKIADTKKPSSLSLTFNLDK